MHEQELPWPPACSAIIAVGVARLRNGFWYTLIAYSLGMLPPKAIVMTPCLPASSTTGTSASPDIGTMRMTLAPWRTWSW